MLAGQDQRIRHTVFQLPDIAGPVIVFHGANGFRSKTEMIRLQATEKIVRQWQDIGPAFAQRFDVQWKDSQASNTGPP